MCAKCHHLWLLLPLDHLVKQSRLLPDVFTEPTGSAHTLSTSHQSFIGLLSIINAFTQRSVVGSIQVCVCVLKYNKQPGYVAKCVNIDVHRVTPADPHTFLTSAGGINPDNFPEYITQEIRGDLCSLSDFRCLCASNGGAFLLYD